jgi:hypothetical protein
MSDPLELAAKLDMHRSNVESTGLYWAALAMHKAADTLRALVESEDGWQRRGDRAVAAESALTEARAALRDAAFLAEFLTPEQRATYECGDGATVDMECDCEAHAAMVRVSAALSGDTTKADA